MRSSFTARLRLVAAALPLAAVLGCSGSSGPTAVSNFTLTVTRSGAGAGDVSSAPSGVSCGATCAGSFASGTVITLTATPAIGSAFAGWSGGGCVGTGTCVVTLSAATTVTATFTLQSFTIGGTAGGLLGVGCVLQLNGGQDLTLTGNGPFAFANPLPFGSSYTVTVSHQPNGPNQTCVVSNGTGTVGGAVSNVAVNCTTDTPLCASATNLGSISGDVGTAAITPRTGTGNAWFRIQVTEDDSQIVTNDLRARVTLNVPAGVDYDLFVYCGACGTGASGFSNASTGQTELLTVGWNDALGVDDTGTLIMEIRYYSGSSAAPWTLNVVGNIGTPTIYCP